MTKRLVEIDDDLLRRARNSAGTDTIKATVEGRIAAVTRQPVKWVASAGTLDR
jgi:Arc/MetJ family transcription regulator